MSMMVIGIGGLAVTAAGTAYSIYNSEQQKKAAQSAAGGGGYTMPDYGQILGNQEDAAKGLGKVQLDFAQKFADQSLAMYPQITQAERGATSLQRQGDLGDLRTYGKRYFKTLQKISPGYRMGISNLNAQIAHGQDPTALEPMLIDEARAAGPSALRTSLESQAGNELALGRALTPEEEQQAQQAARAAWSARGLAFSNPAAVAEVLNRDQYGTQRQDQRRQFAMGVSNLAGAEDARNHQFQLGVNDDLLRRLGMDRQFGISALGAQQNALSPLLAFMGQRSAISPLAGGQLMGEAPNVMQAGIAATGQGVDWAHDAANTQFNAAQAAQIAQQNNNAAITGAAINAAGQFAGQGISAYGNQYTGRMPATTMAATATTPANTASTALPAGFNNYGYY